jgi:ABC-type multidrug transport system permease subunit
VDAGLFVAYLLVLIAFLFAVAVVVCPLALAFVGFLRAVRPRPCSDRNRRTMRVFARALVAGVLGLIVTIGVVAALWVAEV